MVVWWMLLPLVCAQPDYCSLSPEHTLCQHQGPGAACDAGPLHTGVTWQEAGQIVEIHNRYRSQVARGEERSQPSASNIKQMAWDAELALIAQMHADQCKFAHDCTECRRTERFGVGQNLYIYKQSVAAKTNDWEGAVADWYQEVKDFPSSSIEPFQFSSATGHYTQLVWAESDRVGCGATSYTEGQWFTTLYVCNYGPNGNNIQGQMYRQGTPCSQCGAGYQCSSQYPGLCGNISSPPPPSSSFLLPEQGTPGPAEQGSISNTIQTPPARLLTCNFEEEEPDCETKSKGKAWREEDLFGNKYQGVRLDSQEKTQFFFEKKISAPQGKIACIDFRFQKYSEGAEQGSLTVLAVPTRGKAGRVSIVETSQDQDTWVRALVTLRNINTSFTLVVKGTGPGILGLDDLAVTQGKCTRNKDL